MTTITETKNVADRDDAVKQLAKDVESWGNSDKFDFVSGLALAAIKTKDSGEITATASCIDDFVDSPKMTDALVRAFGEIISDGLIKTICQNENFELVAKTLDFLQTSFIKGLAMGIPDGDRQYVLAAMHERSDKKSKDKGDSKNGD